MYYKINDYILHLGFGNMRHIEKTYWGLLPPHSKCIKNVLTLNINNKINLQTPLITPRSVSCQILFNRGFSELVVDLLTFTNASIE